MTTPPPPTQETAPLPPPRPRRFLRSRSDRVLGGVCGGLGQYFNVDPLLFRIATVVLAIIGGVSFIAYPALWLFVPRDDGTGNPEPLPVWRLLGGRDGQPPGLGRALLIVALVLVAIGGGIALFFGSAWVTALGGGVVVASIVVVLGLLAVGGSLTGHRRARWLVLPALVLAIPSGVVAAAGVEFKGGYGEREYRPATIAAIPANGYELAAGRMWIDLRDVPLAPRTTTRIPVELGMGALTVVVPENVCVQTDVRAGAGYLDVLGHEQGGFDVRYQLTGARSSAPRVLIDSHVGMGATEVVHNPSQSRLDDHRGRNFDGPPFAHDDSREPLTNRACVQEPRG
jgi:phage shock protein PspC (stress-responsive transcriptional regulator)